MNKVITDLKNIGCDVDGALKRMLDSEDFYLKFLLRTIKEPSIELLKDAIDKEDIKATFEYGHALKGVLGNMGLTPAYDIITDLVEPVRAGIIDGAKEKYDEFMKVFKQISDIVNQNN